MAFTPLAENVYRLLYRRVPAANPRINYGTLVSMLDAGHDITANNDRRLDLAYREIVLACQARNIPPLTAILVALDDQGNLSQPSDGFFKAAHPGAAVDDQLILWATDYGQACQTIYPEPEVFD